ncbi:MAG: iron ABC transporter permease [Kocuria rhizophila]|nr:iron ABC transporter permease [Kocuria rhizophila]
MTSRPSVPADAPAASAPADPDAAGAGAADLEATDPVAPARRRGVVFWLPVLLIAAIAGLFLLSLLVGGRLNTLAEGWQRIPQAFAYAFAPQRLNPDAQADDLVTVMGLLRLPRTLGALLVGAALGMAGTVIQGHTRNPITDPGILGINAGAAAAVVLSIVWGWVSSPLGYVWPALIGCALVTAAVFALSSTGSSAANPLSIILAGAALSAILMAVVNALVLSDQNTLDRMRQWATGSVSGVTLEVAAVTVPFVLVGAVLAMAQGPGLNLLALGEAVAESLGLDVTRQRVLGLLAVALLGGAATAAAGPVAFIGLAAPHMVRSLLGPDYRLLVPYSALLGAALALGADVLGRVIGRPGELQMGIVMALVGVPFFVVLIRQGKVTSL